jgi:iron complex outermembrane receptor protein
MSIENNRGKPSCVSRASTLTSSVSLAALGAALLCVSLAGAAQAEDQATANASAGTTTLEEVVVSARRVKENLQNVPASIGVIGSKELAQRQIQSLNDIQSVVPNLSIHSNGIAGGGSISVRGSTSSGLPNPTADGSVGRYLDGVYIARIQGSSFDIPEIDQVEVLRGPQGTLYGRNVTAGAVSFSTRNPSGSFGGNVDLTAGNYNRNREHIAIDLPEFHGFSALISYLHDFQDPTQKNPLAGTTYLFPQPYGTVVATKGQGDKNSDNIFFALRYTGIENLVATYKYDQTRSSATPPATQAVGIPPGAAGGPFSGLVAAQPPGQVPVSFNRIDTIPLDFNGPGNVNIKGHNLTVEYKVNDSLSLKNILGYRELRTDTQGQDLDGGNLRYPFPPIAGAAFCFGCSIATLSQKQFSDEFQIIGKFDKIDYIAGVYYFQESGHAVTFYALGKVLAAPPTVNAINPATDEIFGGNDNPNIKSVAGYGSVKYHPTDRIELSAGTRYTSDDRSNRSENPFDLGYAKYKGDAWTYDVSGTYKVLENVNVYARYATGYLSGGVFSTTTFKPEETKSVEAGVKSRLFDRRATINVSVFHTETTNLQRANFAVNLGGSYIFNIGQSKTNGIELETNFQVGHGVTLGANVGYNDPKLTGLPASTSARNTSPKTNGTGFVQYDAPRFDNGSHFSFRIDTDYRSEYYGVTSPLAAQVGAVQDLSSAFLISQGFPGTRAGEIAYETALDNAARLGGYWMANARVSLLDVPVGSTRGSLAVWVKNLTDERKLYFDSNYGNIVGGAFEEPRTYGVDLSVKF